MMPHPTSLFLTLLFLLCLSCSRQPVGVTAGSASTVAPAPVADGAVRPDPEVEAAIAERAAPESMDARAPEDPGAAPLPDAAAVKAQRREEVRARRRTVPQPPIESNETAEIENQASLGQAPLAEPGYREEAAADNTEVPLFSFRKSNCYGDCEAYTFDLKSGGMTSLLVDQGEIAQGLYNRQLYSVDYAELNRSIDSLRQLDLAPVYPVGEEIPADIPYRQLILPDGEGKPREVKVYYEAPPALERFMDRLEVLIGEQAWERATPQPRKRN
ncbi:hypothetical protein GGR26_003389 [Lewinella marina]|uniref:DUF6438 domain-containing protein n=1 Tax=Neolewinella marina TaxID=438751 RepID=A0A2G0CCK6_9BACT|nr:hypothetical protein [Neolewinella marina]NJB87605.1 hypothetical protein [Neolewinella marina]PHK97706.1 hypothetical protein CGL56_14870 [Neolewinella marina]